MKVISVIFIRAILFYTGNTEDASFRNNHYNILNGRLVYLRPTNHLSAQFDRSTNSTYSIRVSTRMLSEGTDKTILPPRVEYDNTTDDQEFRGLKVSKPPDTTIRPIPPGRLKGVREDSNEETKFPTLCYDDALVMRAHLNDMEDIKFIKSLQRSKDIQLWSAGAYFMDFLVQRAKKDVVEAKLAVRKENYTCLITSLKPYILQQRYERSEAARKSTLIKFDFKKYVSLESIEALFDLLANSYPTHVEYTSIGRSHEGRDIWALRVNKQKSTKAMVLVGGIHGRDWASITSVLSVLGYLMKEENEQKSEFFDSLDWYFIPVLNPDGYQFTRFHDRFWTKNRHKMGDCYGVDLNSNFGKNWDKNPMFQRSKDPCDDDYAGSDPFSEEETKAFRDFIETLLKQETVAGFIDVQCYGQTITYPYGGAKLVTDDWYTHSTYAQGMRQNIYSQTKMHYTFAPSYDVPYPRSGLSIDWAYSLGIKHSYIIQTRDINQYGYLLPNNQIDPAGTDIIQALKSLSKRIKQN